MQPMKVDGNYNDTLGKTAGFQHSNKGNKSPIRTNQPPISTHSPFTTKTPNMPGKNNFNTSYSGQYSGNYRQS